MKKAILCVVLAWGSMTGWAQKHLPDISYSQKPAILKGRVLKAKADEPDMVRVKYLLSYTSGTGDGVQFQESQLDADGCFVVELPVGMTLSCQVRVGESDFTCFVVPGETVSFTLDEQKAKTKGLRKGLKFGGTLPDFNLDVAYAKSEGFDPDVVYGNMEQKRNMNQLLDELPQKSEEGYFEYLQATYERVNARIDTDKHLGSAYREYAKAVNHYRWGDMMVWCGQSIQYQGIETDEQYEAYEARLRQRYGQYMQGDPWANPLLSYAMWGRPDDYVQPYVDKAVKLPDSYRKCYLATTYLIQMGQEKELLSEAQKDSVKTLLPELAAYVLGYNDRMEQELAFVSEQGMSNIRELPSDIAEGDVLSALVAPYRGKPVLLDLWETTCGPCRLAFKEMHQMKIDLANKMHFVSVVSERSNRDTWLRLIPNYIGEHYYLTAQQLEALHKQIPCNTSGVPVWVLINADGTIHHAFVGYRPLQQMMEEITPYL